MASSTALLTTPAEEPGPKNPPVEVDFPQEASKQDLIAARCSAAMETKELGLNTESDCREATESIQKTRLKITVGGEEIVVTDQICKIVRIILSFKDIIGAGISAKPMLPWRGPECVRTSAPWEGILDLWCRIYSELACALPPDL